jgi:hypothetical protein
MFRNLVAALWAIACIPLAISAQMSAGTPVRYLPDRKLWVLETERTSYVQGVNELDELQQPRAGARLLRFQ